MNSDIDNMVRHCQPCQESGKSTKPEKVPVTAVPPPLKPFEKVGIDVCGPFFTAPKHQRFVVVLEDYFSKYPEILLTGDITSQRLISWLEEIFASYGNPDVLLSDNGTNFVSREFEDFLQARNIKHNRSAVYNPRQNGLVEVFNRSVKFGAQVLAAEGKPFGKGITDFLMAFRSTPNEDGVSPAELLRGWKMRTNHQVLPSTFFSDLDEIEKTYMQEINQVSLKDRQKIVKARFKNRRYGRNNGQYIGQKFNLGDWVKVQKPRSQVLKGQSPYGSPLRVIKILGKWTYMLSDRQKHNSRRMKKFFPSAEWEDQEMIHYEARTDEPDKKPETNQDTEPRRSERTNKGVPPQRYCQKESCHGIKDSLRKKGN